MANKFHDIPNYKARKEQVTAKPEEKTVEAARNEMFQSNANNQLHPAQERALSWHYKSQPFFHPVRAFGDLATDKCGPTGIPGCAVPQPPNVIPHPGVSPQPKRSGGKDRVPSVTRTTNRTTGE